MHTQSFAPVLVQSTNSLAVASDPANQVWLGLFEAVDGPLFEELARCYFLALCHFRKFVRPVMPDVIEICADDKQQAQRDLYETLRQKYGPLASTWISGSLPSAQAPG